MDNNSKVQELVGVIKSIVKPENHSDLNINLHHQTLLYGNKSVKKVSLKRPKKKCKTLNRKQSAELGLFTLPTHTLKYSEMLPLHHLWLDYIKQHLSITDGMKAPEPHEPNYEPFSKLLGKADFHGAIVRVVRSKCPGHVGSEGIVAMDTKNTFKIVSKDNRLRTLPKQDSVFQIVIDNLQFTIYGRSLGIRPAERSVKKIKTVMDLEL